MVRGDNLICGTTTTGTGTLTLAATPGPPGGVDFDVFARATGIGFGNSAAIPVSYTIIEYSDNTFTTAKATEKGIGTLTLGGSAGIANCTLARTTLQTSATSLNAQPATQNIVPGTGISIGTAANTLVFIGASAADVMAISPYLDVTTENNGMCPLSCGVAAAVSSTLAPGNGTEYYINFVWPTTMLVKRVVMQVHTVYTGGTSNLYGRLYGVGTNGRPGKLILDYGVAGTAGSSLSAAGSVQTAAATNGYFLTPGSYFLSMLATFTGGSGTPDLFTNPGMVIGGNVGFDGVLFFNTNPFMMMSATGGNAVAPDPANLTGYTGVNGQNFVFAFKSA